MPSSGVATARVASVRAFNRFYTNRIGVLRDGLLRTPHPLAEARVLFELGQRESTEVADLRRGLDMDAGQLSRLLARLEAGSLVTRARSAGDGRRRNIRLTEAGAAAFAQLDARSAAENRALLERLPDHDQERLVAAMDTVRDLLSGASAATAEARLRPPGPGELGWIVERHGALYAQEYGWDAGFEALVARIVADFAEHHDPAREAAWIAALDGRPAGCVLCVRKDDRRAQLRLLLVEPWARGHGLGARLIDETIRFARAAGYAEMVLWTNDVLHAARRLYECAGFELVEQGPHQSFGHDLVEQTWSRRL